MTRLNICRGIALLASLAMGPQTAVVCGESSTSNFSTRFLESVEQAAQPSMEAGPLAGIDNEVEHDITARPSGQRRELSWWSFALQTVHLPHPHPPHHSDEGGSDGGSSGGSGGGNDGSGSGSGGDGSGNGTSTSKNLLAPGSLPFWMLIAAASAAAIAIAAMVIGSRRKGKEEYHPLKGSIERRMKLFGGMADGCCEGRELCGAQNEPPLSPNDSGLMEREAEYKEMV